MKTGIPKQFQLAGHTVKVRIVPASKWKHKDSVGAFNPNKYTIDILATITGTARQQVLCHEMFHALFYVAGQDELYQDEELVDRLGHLLQQALTTFA